VSCDSFPVTETTTQQCQPDAIYGLFITRDYVRYAVLLLAVETMRQTVVSVFIHARNIKKEKKKKWITGWKKGINREWRKTKKTEKQNGSSTSHLSRLFIHSVVYTGICLSAPPLGQVAVEIRHKNYKW
jgi:hypothetical protein